MQTAFSSFINHASALQSNDELLLEQTGEAIRVVGQEIVPAVSLVHRLSMIALPIFQGVAEGWRSLFRCPIPFSLPVRDTALFRPTTQFLEQSLGKARFARTLMAIGLKYTELEWRGFGLTKKELTSLLQASSFIYSIDIVELLNDLKSEAPSVRGCTGESLVQLKARCAGVSSVVDCPTDVLDALVSVLQPCSTLKDLLLGGTYDDSISVGSVLSASPYERSSVAYFHLGHKADLTEDEWAVIFLKRLTTQSWPQGLLVRSPKGYLMLSHTVETGGASKWFLKSLAPEILHSKVIYRGTRGALISPQLVDSFLSIREDLTKEMGSHGIMETFEETKKLLTDPANGFVRTPEEQVDMYGYSLGGAQAMRDSVLFEKNVHRLFTLCSPGVDTETVRVFSEKMRQRPVSKPMEVTHFSDAEDFCPNFGEALLGSGCANTSVRVRAVCQVPLSKEPYEFPEKVASGMKDIATCVALVGKGILAHVRVAPYEPYRTYAITSDQPVVLEKYLSHDREYFDSFWEGMRSGVLLANVPFHDFAREAS